jgi:putative membrane protein|tara:strand:+ start:8631 stop:9236 length:606 start_codon:yes stop_codon:yes gene_type:complete
MYIEPRQKKILWAFLLMIAFFISVFIYQLNYEFIGYVVVVLLLSLLVIVSNRYVTYPTYVLWGLLGWAFLHMLGGVEFEPGSVIYTYQILDIVGEPYSILKYDQITHTYGFFVATLAMFYVIRKYLSIPFSWIEVGIVVAMAGVGLGAFNEIVEFIMVVTLPDTNVGGYENTIIDLVSNLIGAIAAVFFLRHREKKRSYSL